jgi:hypothetical protein
VLWVVNANGWGPPLFDATTEDVAISSRWAALVADVFTAEGPMIPPAAAADTAMATDPDPMLELLLLLPDDPMLKRFAGHPYLLLLRCLSMSHRRLKALPQDGHRWVPRWMCR